MSEVMLRIAHLSLVIFCLFLLSCEKNNKQKNSTAEQSSGDHKVHLEYAKNFSIIKNGNTRLIQIDEPYPGASEPAKYLLVPKGEKIPDHNVNIQIIRTPVERIVCTSTTHLPALEMLGVSQALKGFPSTQYISSPELVKNVKEGKIKELGLDSHMNMEILADIQPDIIFGYAMNGNSKDLEQISRIGIPVILHADFLEETPLGRAEWIKFMGAFFDKEELAGNVFEKIKTNYLEVKSKVENVKVKPTAFTGVVYNDVWYVAGGKSWAAKFFNAAGIDYLWKNEPSSGSLSLAFEVVYEKAAKADLWIGAAQYLSLEELKKADPRYTRFKAYEQKEVYSYIKKINESGGNAYFETGAARPDLVLSDLVKIAHPELMEDYETFFYQKLKDN